MRFRARDGYILIALLIFAGEASPKLMAAQSSQFSETQPLKVELSVSEEFLRVDIFNSSESVINVNKRLLYGSEANWTELAFIIEDAHGAISTYMPKATTEPPGENDRCFLWPRQFVGTQIPLKEIRANYRLGGGTYSIIAEYLIRSEDGKLLSRLMSPAVSVSFAH
jgi:hypothetical protein